ncbi:MAG: type II secretion system F family protein [Xylophilus ampelinus]
MPPFLNHPDLPRLLAVLAAALTAAGLLAVGASLLWNRRPRGAAGLDRALGRLAARGAATAPDGPEPDPRSAEVPVRGPSRLLHREGGVLDRWLASRAGALLVADEDRRLIARCGFRMRPAQRAYLLARVASAALAALAAGASGAPGGLAIAALAAAGFMAPKWFLRRQAQRRARFADAELPLLVDVVRLLQGVGLGLDQSLQVAASEFRGAMPVLGAELDAANRQYAQGRTREQSLQRFAQVFDNEQMASLAALLVQVDRHGGAVQEPLGRFGDRLRERRRADLKTRIGRISVKMTGIMVCTLLPALLVVAAGPGFVAIVRSLGAMAR